MSTSHTIDIIDYPESDGLPMGETDLHRDWMIRILDILRQRYRGQSVYVASNVLVYFEQGRPSRFVVPDNFVVLDCDPGRRRTFKTWEEGKAPNVIFEVTSRSTSREDLVTKPPIYDQMGVSEYFLYDPSGAYLEESLLGFRRENGFLTKIDFEHRGVLVCETIGIELSLDGDDLVMTCAKTGKRLLTEAEDERQQKELERQQKDLERSKREAETAARRTAEARVQELLEEIERLKRDSR